ncbi:MAG: (Fe-S)-binding protein [Desulfobacterales bacterium]|nr:(Fe-S)-binding protein [Desulfobacterales bacterium]
MDYIKSRRIKLNRSKFKMLATYHDPCNYGRRAERMFGHGYYEEPRWILEQCTKNWVDLYPNRSSQLCCGGGGGTMTTGYNKERIFYGRRKMEQIKETGAEMVIVPCHSCHGQLNSIKAEYGMENLQVKYLWELVADCLVV